MPRVLAHLVVAVAAASLAWPTPASALPLVPPPPFAFDDPGSRGVPGAWRQEQWALTGRFGVRAPRAWDHLLAAGRPGADQTVVAVLDSGVRETDDLDPTRLVPGFDALHGGRTADTSGHGTHVASVVAGAAGNGAGLVGLAYGARILPVRVLDRAGDGEPESIASGIRWAARQGADVLALAFAFGPEVRAGALPDVAAALDDADRRGVVVVAAAGNDGLDRVSLPARHPSVIAVGATTRRGRLTASSNHGARLDLVAPGGGIAALGFRGRGPVRVLERRGTSHAVPHVAAAAALVLASGVLGPDPSPDMVRRRLRATARDLGAPGADEVYGAGLLDAGAATAP